MDRDGNIDLVSLEQHLARLPAAKIDVVLLMVSISEFALLSLEERLMLIREAHEITLGTLVANAASTRFNDILNMAQEAHHVDYDAVMVLPPYYSGQTSGQLLHYFRGLRLAIKGKWFAYNLPARTGCDLTPELIATLAAQFPDFAGIKDTVDCQPHAI